MAVTDPALVAAPTIEVKAVSKWFGQKVAVSQLTCSFGPGLTGLLGPNGAGKTTLLRMMTGLMTPSEGEVTLLGGPPRESPEIYAGVGLVPEEDAVYPTLSGRAYVEYAARLSRVADPVAAAAEALATVELTADADRSLAGYSKGMRQRAKVAAALVHHPQVLVLDEPLNGTDPVQRARLIDVFRRLASEGRTVIVSSHVLAEVERMADRVLAMVDGKLAAAGDIAAIRNAMSDIPFRVRLTVDDPRSVAAARLGEGRADSAAVEGDDVHVATEDLPGLGRRLPGLVAGLGVRLTRMEPEDESLESVFRYLVRRR